MYRIIKLEIDYKLFTYPTKGFDVMKSILRCQGCFSGVKSYEATSYNKKN